MSNPKKVQNWKFGFSRNNIWVKPKIVSIDSPMHLLKESVPGEFYMPNGVKLCNGSDGCGVEKLISEFIVSPSGKDGLGKLCKDCRAKVRQIERKDLIENNPEKLLLRNATYSNDNNSANCFLALPDIYIPDVCPFPGCGLPFDWSILDLTPSTDRMDPKKGYNPDNIWTIHFMCNRKKADLSLEEHFKLGRDGQTAFKKFQKERDARKKARKEGVKPIPCQSWLLNENETSYFIPILKPQQRSNKIFQELNCQRIVLLEEIAMFAMEIHLDEI